MGFGSKGTPRNGIFGVFPARKMGREPKNERGGWGRGRILCEYGIVYIARQGDPCRRGQRYTTRLYPASTFSKCAHETGHYPRPRASLLIEILTGRHVVSTQAIYIIHYPNNINRDSGIEITEALMRTIKMHNKRERLFLVSFEKLKLFFFSSAPVPPWSPFET